MGASNKGKSPNSMLPIFIKNSILRNYITQRKSIMNKHLKELIFILLLSLPIITMLLLSSIVDGPTDISFENYNRTSMLIGNSFALIFFSLPYFAIRNKSEYSMKVGKIDSSPILVIILITFFFMILNSSVIEWNKSINFPEFMNSFEQWALTKENQLEKVTLFLISFDNISEYLIGVLTIALIPGIFEEFFFRGVLQKNLFLISKNVHLAVWISAILFSAIHMQFYGFFPRLFMGVLFGYMFYWSGNIIYPMLAHTFNNFFSLTLFYGAKQGLFGTDFDISVNTAPDIPKTVIIISFVIFFILIINFKRNFKTHE